MLKIIFLKGIPASGKSTWSKDFISKNPEYIRVNKDELRIMLGSEGKPCRNEKRVIAKRDEIIIDALRNSKNVIVDDTNLNPSHEERVREIASQLEKELDIKIDFEIKLFKISLTEAIERDSKREAKVGAAVIARMYNQINDSDK